MKQFNILDRHLHLHQHYLLEASAGTGKTFSIQNIVIRLLIEPDTHKTEPLTIEQILVVTFTRAATRDLRQRIRANLEYVVHAFNEWLNKSEIVAGTADYLIAYFEQGTEFIEKAKKRLQHALFLFDQAQIFTIHGFCARMLKQYALESDTGLNRNRVDDEEPLPTAEVMRVIRDFFRTELRSDVYSTSQLSLILKQDPEQKKLLRAVMSGYEFLNSPTFQEIYFQFVKEMKGLKKAFDLNSINMIEDFKAQHALYRNYKNGETKAETLTKVIRFASLFDQNEWSQDEFDELLNDGLVWVQALDSNLLKSRSVAPQRLNYPSLTSQFKEKLEPLVVKAMDFSILLARLARDCQQLLKRYQQEEERLSPDDLLRKMQWSLNQSSFLTQVRSLYAAAIIDEFQDTDPVQWNIFHSLFLANETWPGHLYLVGDPKQSIYSFRQADIYTYLTAAKTLGEQSCFSLDTNYRSQPSLVDALNTLFAAEHVPDLIPLPKQDFHLPYQPVKFSDLNKNQLFNDERGSIHFFLGDGQVFKKGKLIDFENQIFFPFIAKEIDRLRDLGLDFHRFAVLVRDRHQALRLAEFFDRYRIPYLNQRGMSLAESAALTALIDILKAILHPHHLGFVKTALGSPLIGWTHEDLKKNENINSILIQFQLLRHQLLNEGFAPFIQAFLQSKWQKQDYSVLEALLKQEGGLEFYHDLCQIVDLIIDHQYQEWSTPEGLIPFLDLFQVWHNNEDPRIKRFQDPTKNGVKILTLHFSKGLEFDVVFALGLVNRVGLYDELIPIEKDNQLVLAPLTEHQQEYRDYCQENDAEKMRQLYVALTRAKHRLYVPVALHLANNELELGSASPLDLFLARLGQSYTDYEQLYERIKHYNGQSLTHFIETVGQQHHITYSLHQKVDYHRKEEPLIDQFLCAPKQVSVPGRFLFLTSFSSMTHHLSIEAFASYLNPPHDFETLEKSIHTLPADSDTGLLVHRILEKINFSDFKSWQYPYQASHLIQPFVQKTLFKDWQTILDSLIFYAIKTPLPLGNRDFCLADLPIHQMYREMDFLFSYGQHFMIEGLSYTNGMVKGVIDLIFSYENKYYILDWKTNWLGPQANYYQPLHLHQAMLKHHYFLQASLYTEALRRYLGLVDARPFEECFGGVIYSFVRGIEEVQSRGYYHFIPADQVLEHKLSNLGITYV